MEILVAPSLAKLRIWFVCSYWRQWFLSIAVVAGGVFIMLWLGLLNSVFGFDAWLERQYFDVMEYSSPTALHEALRIIRIDKGATNEDEAHKPLDFDKNRAAWRTFHAKLIRALQREQASVVGFDMFFEGSTDAADQELAEAIRETRVSASKTRIVVGVDSLDEQDQSPQNLSHVMKTMLASEQWGLLRVGDRRRESGEHYLRRILLAEAYPPISVSASKYRAVAALPLQIAMSYWQTGQTPLVADIDPKGRQVILSVGTTEICRIACDLRSSVHDQRWYYQALMPLRVGRRQNF